MRFEGKVVLVTGSGQGIGEATALCFAREGADVIINDIKAESIERVADKVTAMGRRAMAVKADISSSQEVNRMVEKALGAFKKIDILVNNAGIDLVLATTEQTEAQWDKVVDTNLKGAYNCCQAAGKAMVKERQGKIVNLASTAASFGVPKTAAYCASKGGILALTRALAIEWAEFGICVNAVSPGYVETEMVTKLKAQSPAFFKQRMNAIPVRRGGKPEEIAYAILFLASNQADYITGQVLTVDGGTSALHAGFVRSSE